jgi:hypothetical protein
MPDNEASRGRNRNVTCLVLLGLAVIAVAAVLVAYAVWFNTS